MIYENSATIHEEILCSKAPSQIDLKITIQHALFHTLYTHLCLYVHKHTHAHSHTHYVYTHTFYDQKLNTEIII